MKELLKLLKIQTAYVYGDEVKIIYFGGDSETKKIAALSSLEKNKVLYVNQGTPIYTDFGYVPAPFEAVYLDGRRKQLAASEVADAQDSTSGEKYKKQILNLWQPETQLAPPFEGSWLRANYGLVLEQLAEADRLAQSLYITGDSNSDSIKYEQAKQLLQSRIFSKLSSSEKAEFDAERNRRYELNSGSSDFFSQIVKNPADMFLQKHIWQYNIEKPVESALITVAIATGFGDPTALAALTSSGQAAATQAVNIVTQGTQLVATVGAVKSTIDNALNPKQPEEQAQVISQAPKKINKIAITATLLLGVVALII